MNREEITLKSSSSVGVGKLAGSIANFIREGKRVKVSAIGAGAVNQAVKSIATAQGMTATSGIEIYTKMGFDNTKINGENLVVMVFTIYQK